MQLRTKVALGGTAIYLLLVSILLLYRFEEFICLELNALGDFLAGVFGPLALGWVVVGYFQQGDELQQSTEALRLQGEELRNSVEEQHKLAEISRQALEHERQIREDEVRRRRHSLLPLLTLSGGHPEFDSGEYSLECELVNYGSQIHDVQIVSKRGNSRQLEGTYPTLSGNGKISFHISWAVKEPGTNLDVEVSYADLDGVYAASSFTAVKSGEFGALDFIKLGSFQSYNQADDGRED